MLMHHGFVILKGVYMGGFSIKQWSIEDRPREKAVQVGIRNLSTAELLAIVFCNGYKETSAVELARNVLYAFNNNVGALHKVSAKELTRFKGIGLAKAVALKASLELGSRSHVSSTNSILKVTSSQRAYTLIYPKLHHLIQEEFWITLLSNDLSPIETICLSKGGTSQVFVDVKLVCKHAVLHLAKSIIIYHNHPSGSICPSEQDKQLTKNIQQALEVFQIKLADHLIIGQDKYLSFADEGLL